MIPNKRKMEVTSTLDGQEIGMTIDMQSIQHVISVLTDLYSDPETAVLREYATNAYDAHVEAGNPLPIQVYTPTQLAPFLRIKDFGVGLDAYDIEHIYSKYGKSTKTETNEQTGVLGLGCKSALTYTNQFTVVGIKEGVKTAVSVSRDEDGVGTMTIVDMSETDEANGVEIIVPTKAANNFHSKAVSLFSFWPQGSILLNDVEPERYEGLAVTTEITLVKRDHVTDRWSANRSHEAMRSYVVMGNVPYPIDPQHMDFNLEASYGLVARIPNGSVNFTPSREALQYTRHTKDTLERVAVEMQQGLLDAVNQEIGQAASMPEALRVAIRWRSVLPRALRETVFQYRNQEIPEQIVAPEEGHKFYICSGTLDKDYYGKVRGVGKHSSTMAIDLTTVVDAYWVEYFDQGFTPAVKKKLVKYCEEKGLAAPRNFILYFGKLRNQLPWVENDRILPWSEIKLVKLPRTVNGRTSFGRLAGSYDMFVCSAGGDSSHMEEVEADDIDTDMPLFYDVGDHPQAMKHSYHLAKLEDEFTMVYFSSNREAKFCRLFPMARPFYQAMREYADHFMAMLNGVEREALSMLRSMDDVTSLTEMLPALAAREAQDPEIRRALRMAKVIKDPRYHALHRHRAVLEPFGATLNEWRSPITEERYPLFVDGIPYMPWDTPQERVAEARRRHRRHNLLYLNAVYAADNRNGGD